MKKAVVFGAGQCGKWLGRLLAASGFDLVGFADNDPSRVGQMFDGRPVFSPMRLGSLEWDVLFVAMKGQDRVDAVRRQLAELGVPEGRVETPPSFLTDFDARYLELNMHAFQFSA
jgi:predicted dinucleotide-binding enzyme